MFKILLFVLMGLRSFEFTPSENLFMKDWKAKEPLVIDGIKMKGFKLLLLEDYDEDWNKEGVMYNSIHKGAKQFPSSFDYIITPDTLKIKIKFSASGLKVGNIYNIPYTISKKELTLKYYGQVSIYK
jgi:hypothetical protein